MDQYFDGVQKKRFSKAVMAVVVLLAVFLGIKSLNSLKEYGYIGQGVYPTNVISVNGTGEVFTVPDVGTFSFSVVEEGKSVKEAQDKASKKINATIDAVKSLGVAEKDIKTSGYNSYPKYEYLQNLSCTNGYCPPGKQNLTGYEVNQTITIKIRKTADAGAILTKVGDSGATNISSLEFVVDDSDKAEADARDLAIADAKEKAKVLSKSLGVKLSRVVNFSESGSYPMPYAYGRAGEKAMTMDAVSSQAMPPQLPTGENKIVSNVTITYEIR